MGGGYFGGIYFGEYSSGPGSPTFTATLTASASVTATIVRTRKISASATGVASVLIIGGIQKNISASSHGVATVTCSVVRLRLVAASSGSARASASVVIVRTRHLTASSTGVATVTAATDEFHTFNNPEGVSIAFEARTLVPTPAWTRLDDPDGYHLVSSWTIDRGRVSEQDRTGTGTATVGLIDTDGTIDPTNPSGPFYGDLDPMKQAAIALHNPVTSSWHTIFRGYVGEWLYNMDVSEKFCSTTLELNDGFDLLAALEMTPGHHGDPTPNGSEGDIFFEQTWVFNRINKALDDAGWPADQRLILTGNVIAQGAMYARRDQLLTVLFDCADAEFPGLANVYIDKIGRVTFHGRFARFEPENPQYQIDFWSAGDKAAADLDASIAPIAGLQFRRSKDDLINAALCIPQNIEEAKVPNSLVKNDASIAKYGWRSISFDNLLTEAGRVGHDNLDFNVDAVEETKLYSKYFVENYKSPSTRVQSLVFRPCDPESFSGPALWELMCKVDIGDVISLQTSHPGGGGFDESYFVEGIHYTASPMRTDIHDVTMTLDVSPMSLYAINPFEDDSSSGGSTPTISGPNSPPQVGDTLTGNP